MGNCCATPPSQGGKSRRKKKPNPFTVAFNRGPGLVVLRDPTGRDLGSRYELGGELGRGEFGITYLCTETATGARFACKSISKRMLRTPVDVEDVRREVEIMRHMPPHPNIVSLHAAYEDEDAVHLVMELCEGGELFDRIVARGHYTERAAAAVMRTIVEVVQMCHRHGVMHRDLKPENFLYANKKENSPLKAIDFGLSMFFRPGERFTEIVGSPYYMAPEVLKKNYGPEADVWSAGVILYILLCGVPPFWAETEQGVAQAIIRSVVDFKRDPWPRVSEPAKDLVRRMLDPNPTTRLTAAQVLEHPWLHDSEKMPDIPLGDTVRARLQQFAAMNKLKKKALRVVAEHLSEEEVADIRQMFDSMDVNKNGKLTFEEFKAGLRKLGNKMPDSDLQILMDAADVDKNGTLDYGEFVAVSIHVRKIGNDEHIQKAFSYFDQNRSGYIEIEELREALSDELEGNDEDIINGIIHDVDTDKDGKISYDEFAAMMKAGTDWRKASRQYSRQRFNNLSLKLRKDGSIGDEAHFSSPLFSSTQVSKDSILRSCGVCAMGLDVAEMGVGTDLSLDLKMFAAKSVGRVKDTPASAMNDCIRRLEEEKGKIEMFRRELPLCARLLADVIDVMKEEAEKKVDQEEEDGGAGDKSKWMSTAQLWTGNSGREAADSENQENERSSSEAKSHGGGAFVPFKGVGSGEPAFVPPCFRKDDKAYDVGMPDLSLLSPAPIKSTSTVGAAAESHRQVVGFAQAAEKAAAMASSGPSLALQPQSQQQQQARKARRCWSPELHRQFLSALQQLGGPQVGTPKQIRELMKVDGLTNDEVKSHLQKYRLHNRREPNSAVVSQPVLLVNAAGLWIPPEQSSSQSGSPQGPLHFSTSGVAVSSAATVSCEEEDGRSESYGWK